LLYDNPNAPNPRRVRMFLVEKGVEIPTRTVDLRSGEHFSDDFRAVNPGCTVPALVLDDGTAIAESVAICQYLEAVYPDPPLMGEGAAGRALVTMWQRRMEHDGFFAVVEAFRNAAPGLRGRALPGGREVEQIPELAERGRRRYGWFLEDLDRRLQETSFVAGEDFSIADITALVTVDFARRAIKVEPPAGLGALDRWYREVSARPSAGA
jgi:glutathione S-transferase